MNIREEKITYGKDNPIDVKVCRIRHVTPHFHVGSFELIYCLKGSIDLITGPQLEHLKAGQVSSVDFRDIHCIFSKEDNLCILVHIDLTKLDDKWEELRYTYLACESANCHFYQESAMEWVMKTMLSLAYLFQSKTEVSIEKHMQIANRFMDIMLEYFDWTNCLNEYGYTPHSELRERLQRVMRYCQKSYMNKITLSQLAAKEHIDKNYFSQFLKKTSFYSFTMLIKHIRCFEAEFLLLTTDMPVVEISAACGFSTPKYFYMSFKQLWRRTPAEHRQLYAELMAKNPCVEVLDKECAQLLMKDYITDYHIRKTLQAE